MIHHIFRAKLLWGKPVTLFFFGDAQIGSPGFDEEAWNEFKEEFKSTPNSYAIGLGDYMDWARPSLRGKLRSALDDDSHQQLDAMYKNQQNKMLDEMGFMKGRLVGLHEGHHEWYFADGSNGTQRMCSALGCKYLTWMASTRMAFYGTGGHSVDGVPIDAKSYTIISLHGTGSAKKASTDIGWLESNVVPAWGADLYVRGHSCKNGNYSPLEYNEIRRRGDAGVTQRVLTCLNVGGFSRGYTDGFQSSWVERQGFIPQAVGWGKVVFSLGNSKEMGKRSGSGRLIATVNNIFPSCYNAK